MTQNPVQTIPLTRFQAILLIGLLLLLLVIPLALSNQLIRTACSGLMLIVLFFFPGYLLLSLVYNLPREIRFTLGPVLGLVCTTTAYDILANASVPGFFPYLVAALSGGGVIMLVLKARHSPLPQRWTRDEYRMAIAGALVTLCVAPIFWRSGRFSGAEFVFHGPAGQDQLFHVTLLQRLAHHIPPDNFMVSGVRAAVYHYFGDLAVALILRVQTTFHLPATDLFDLYYRSYPTLIYFLIGSLAYLAGRKLLGTAKGGILSILLLLGGGGFGWLFGLAQIAFHVIQPGTMRATLFSTWTALDGVDTIRPLVHRPAYYHGLLIVLAAITLLLRPDRSRRDWYLAGLLLGLMAGFNFTLAATFGAAAVLGSLLLFSQRRREPACDLAGLALFLFIGSLPVNTRMLMSGFHNAAPGFPFRGPNLEYSTATWGPLLGRMVSPSLVPFAALILFPVAAYGIKLLGMRGLAGISLGEERHRGLALLLLIVFTFSFLIGTFFPYQGSGEAIIFLQPTFSILALFALHPIGAWVERNRGNWREAVLWGMLGLTWVQALVAFNFGSEAVFSRETVHLLQAIRLASAPDDVVAYLPSHLRERPIWGGEAESTNFSIMAMTGLDGYFSAERYSKFSAVPGLAGSSPEEILAKAKRLYEQRRDDIGSFIKGDITTAACSRLAEDHVRWIVVSDDALQSISSAAKPWGTTPQIVVYRLGDNECSAQNTTSAQ